MRVITRACVYVYLRISEKRTRNFYATREKHVRKKKEGSAYAFRSFIKRKKVRFLPGRIKVLSALPYGR